jgi:hypothetical protein
MAGQTDGYGTKVYLSLSAYFELQTVTIPQIHRNVQEKRFCITKRYLSKLRSLLASSFLFLNIISRGVAVDFYLPPFSSIRTVK